MGNGSGGGIPAIEITKESIGDGTYVSDDSEYQEGGGGGRRRSGPPPHSQQQVRLC